MYHKKLKKIICSVLSFTLTVCPLYPYADEISDAGREGQTYAKDIVDGYNQAAPQFNNNVMTLPSMEQGVFNNNDTTTINLNDLFPGTSASSGDDISEYFPAGATPDISVLEGVSSDGDAMDNTGLNFQSELYNDANQPNPSTVTGAAYKVLMDMTTMTKPDLTNDPVLTLTRDTFDNIDAISADFGDCSTSTVFNDITSTERIPDYKTCSRVTDKTATCEVNHIYDAGIVKHHSGPYNIMALDDDSINVWIGQVGDNYWGGWCSVYENVTEFKVINPQAITNVTLNQAIWDDYIQIWIGEPGQEEKIYNGPNQYFPPEIGNPNLWDAIENNEPFAPCELSTSWNVNPNIDLTSRFQALSPGDVVRFKVRVSVAGGGEGYARLQIDYDRSKAVLQDIWSPQSCIDAAEGLYDGFASGTVECTSLPNDYQNGCTKVNEVTVCDNDLATPPFPDIPALCEKVQVDVDYDFYKGEICFTAADGSPTCINGGGGDLNTCDELEADPSCGYISQSCLDGAQAQDGTCYVTEEVWDCGEDVQISDVEAETTYECAGPVRCMGSDCLDPEKTQSATFAETAAKLNAAQFMTQDMNCTPITGQQNVNCTVFGGKDYTCKIAVGGVQDCCDVPTNVSTGTYIQALFAMGKLDTSLMALDNGSLVKGAYQTLREPIVNTVTEVTQPFASYIENISGSVTEFFEPVTTFVEELKQQIKDAISDTISDMMGDAAADMGADAATTAAAEGVQDQATEQATNSIIQGASSAASFLMTAYTAYVVAVMVIQMIYECEMSEFELAAKRDTSSCQYVGSYCADDILGMCVEKRESYCCFNSPLSRIINTQIRPQINRPYGDVRNPDCGGIDISEVENIDWSQVDLGEWTALLSQNNLLPDVNAMTLDSLTGSGSDMNLITGDRVDAEQRTQQRLDGLDVDQIRRDAADNTYIDPSGGGMPQ
ncbi:MAG: conjugal transfer mating pair stabilization protein TraN [gamma proteobacterium symbiont of Clathrolucina costata]